MIDHPTSDAVVIVRRCEGNKADKFFVGEFVQKPGILNDLGANHRSASGETRDPPVHVGRCGNLKVPALEVASTEKLPDIGIPRSARAGETSGRSNRWIFESGEDVGQQCGAPKDVIIRKGGDGRRGALEALNHLQALVCDIRSEHRDVGQPQVVAGMFDPVDILCWRDHDNCSGRASID